MEITWDNFWLSPIAVGTLIAAISGILIALGIETHRVCQTRRERKVQASIIFSVLAPPLGEISAAADRARNDPRCANGQAFIAALQDRDPTFVIPVPEIMHRVFDSMHFLPNSVAIEVGALYSDLTGWSRLCARCAMAGARVDPQVALTMPQIFDRLNARVSAIVKAARKANLPVDTLQDIE